MTRAEKIYEESVKKLPANERYELAVMILQHITPESIGEFSWEWTEEDMHDVNIHSQKLISGILEEEEEYETND